MPKNWDTPFGYDKGNKEFSGDTNSQAFFCDVPQGAATPIDSPIASLKYKDKAPTTEDSSADLDGSLTTAPWDTPFTNKHSKGSNQSHN